MDQAPSITIAEIDGTLIGAIRFDTFSEWRGVLPKTRIRVKVDPDKFGRNQLAAFKRCMQFGYNTAGGPAVALATELRKQAGQPTYIITRGVSHATLYRGNSAGLSALEAIDTIRSTIRTLQQSGMTRNRWGDYNYSDEQNRAVDQAVLAHLKRNPLPPVAIPDEIYFTASI